MEHAKLDASPCGHWLRKSKSKSSGRKRGTILEGRERKRRQQAYLVRDVQMSKLHGFWRGFRSSSIILFLTNFRQDCVGFTVLLERKQWLLVWEAIRSEDNLSRIQE